MVENEGFFSPENMGEIPTKNEGFRWFSMV